MTEPALQPRVETLATTTHGRYLVRRAAGESRGLLLGFHGYAEGAAQQLARLAEIPGAEGWTLVSIQGLHRFYRGQDPVASWMTREDRELAMADNLAYVRAVVDRVGAGAPSGPRVVCAGFSQGVAMAFRAACGLDAPADGVIALGGDVPPELGPERLSRVRHALLARGDGDTWYSAEQCAADQVRLRHAGVDLTTYCFHGNHAWTSDVSEAAGHFLHRLDAPGH